MRLPRSLRIDSRKNRRRVALALLVVCAGTLFADITHDTSITSSRDHLTLHINVQGAQAEAFLGNIDSGYRARIEYTMRFVTLDLAFLGIRQTALPQFVVSYDAWWDPFRELYVIETNDGDLLRFENASELWEFFFSLRDYRIPSIALRSADADSLVLESRAHFYPIVFAPGLRILSVFLRDSRQRTDWVRTVLPEST